MLLQPCTECVAACRDPARSLGHCRTQAFAAAGLALQGLGVPRRGPDLDRRRPELERSCRVRLRVAAICLSLAGLAGCVHAPPPPAPVAPDPFAYLKRSALCSAGKLAATPEGRAVSIRTRSDGGLCTVTVSQPEGGAYASFVLSSLPMHGSSLIYNYDKRTHVTYTADIAYAGPDGFAVSLIPGNGRPRSLLRVEVSADASGVPVPPPPTAAPPAQSTKPVTHRRHHRAAHA